MSSARTWRASWPSRLKREGVRRDAGIGRKQLAAVAMFGTCFAETRWPELQKRLSAGKLTEGMQALALGAMLRPKS